MYAWTNFIFRKISVSEIWPKMLLANQIAGFFNQSQDSKLAVSHKEINEINWFLVCPSNRNGSLGFSDFWHNGRLFEHWKTDIALFPGKLIFGPNLGKSAQNGPFIRFFGFFEKFCDVSFSWKWSVMKTNIVIDISPTYWFFTCR